MIIVVDTNILFSACLTPQGRAFEILFHSSTKLISTQVAIEEIARHKQKLIRLSKLPADELETLLDLIIKQLDLIDESIVETAYWKDADNYTREVDSNDIAFVALSLQADGLLWTGDKKLTEHLKKMGFDRVVNTAELSALLNLE